MSRSKKDLPGKSYKQEATPLASLSQAFTVKRPLLWLAVIAFAMYVPTLYMGETDLDDGIAINTFHSINENITNIFASFQRTIFDTQADQYYRPVATDAMILNYQLADHGTNIALFHLVNVLLHMLCVILLFKLLVKLGIKELHSLILAGLFAVHPVLTEAVAWICARVETILAIFVLLFFLKTIDYANTGKIKYLALAALSLLLALFTKETAVAAAPVAFVLLVMLFRQEWKSRNMLIQYAVWAFCYAIWFTARSLVLSSHAAIPLTNMPHDFAYRLPLSIQYLGKIFFPFNLSVFPLQEDTVYYFGVVAAILLAALLFFSKHRDNKMILAGLAVFFMFLLPVFIVPKELSVQTYEYRLYIPFVGILLLLSQTTLFRNGITDRRLLAGSIGVAALFAVINFNYQRSFKDPLAFWTQAEASAPHSSYASMMLAARIGDPVRSNELFRKAFALNPKERYVNYIYAIDLQNKDSVQASEPYLLAEQKITGYYKCDFYLARVAIERKDYNAAIAHLERYLQTEKNDTIANNNLLLLYLDADHDDKAKEQAKRMKDMGLPVQQAVLDHFHL